MSQTALRYSGWALESVIFLPPFLSVFVVVAVSLVLAGWKQRPFRVGLWKPHHWLLLTHCLFFVAAIMLGVLYANPITNPTLRARPNQAAKNGLQTLLLASLTSC